MKLLLLACFVGLALAEAEVGPQYQAPTLYYHETIGIKEAASIKAAEEATDFDGARIVGGSLATLGQYPHFGGLVIHLTFDRTSVCGSALISNTRAVTAAHCWWDGRNQGLQLEVVLGSITLFSGGTRVTANQVVMHHNWNPNNLSNNIAIVSFNWVNYNNNIRNIALPTTNINLVGIWAWTVGFGRTSNNADILVGQRLQQVNLQVITNAVCQQTYGGFVTDYILCTSGAGGRGICAGDSGGPLETYVNGQRTLIGVTSYGGIDLTRCENGYPSLYTRVAAYTTWLRSLL